MHTEAGEKVKHTERLSYQERKKRRELADNEEHSYYKIIKITVRHPSLKGLKCAKCSGYNLFRIQLGILSMYITMPYWVL